MHREKYKDNNQKYNIKIIFKKNTYNKQMFTLYDNLLQFWSLYVRNKTLNHKKIAMLPFLLDESYHPAEKSAIVVRGVMWYTHGTLTSTYALKKATTTATEMGSLIFFENTGMEFLKTSLSTVT